MESNKLKTACIGLCSRAVEFLKLAGTTGLFDVVSVADADMVRAEKIAVDYDCTAFDDFRQFILQNDFDVLIVAEPLHNCIEHVRKAISRRTNILKLPPTAINFTQADELIRFAKKHRVKYSTACATRFSPGFESLCDHLKSVDRNQFYFVNVHQNLSDTSHEIIPDVFADPKLLGGGVLLNNCFEMLDEIVLNFSLPQQVYTLTTNHTSDRKARQYLGEDTASISLKFPEGLIGTFTAAWHLGAVQSPPPFQIYGDKQNIIVTRNRLAVYNTAGEIIEDHKFPYKPEKCIAEMLIDFARGLLFPDEYRFRFSENLDLATMAFIESVYLSQRTAMPESPSRFFEIAEHPNFPFA